MLNIGKTAAYFRERYALGKRSPKGWVPMDCPFCADGEHKKKFALHFRYSLGKCWVCGYKENLVQVIRDIEGTDYIGAKRIIENCDEAQIDAEILQQVKAIKKSNVLLPYGYNTLLSGSGVLADRVRNYLKGRGFNLEYLDMIGFGYCDEHFVSKLTDPEAKREEEIKKDYFGYLIIPFKKQGALQYFIGRDFLGSQFLRYKNPDVEQFGVAKGDLLFNEDAMELYDDVRLVEGSLDAIVLGKETMASMGWSLSETQRTKILKSDIRSLTLVPDKGFYKAAVKTAMQFLDHKIVYVVNTDNIIPEHPEKKDVNELGKPAVDAEIEITEPLSRRQALRVIMG